MSKNKLEKTKHLKDQRKNRNNFIQKKLHGYGQVIDSFIIDNHHKDGVEVHVLTDKCIVLIFNIVTGRLVTELILRENQLRKYYLSRHQNPSYELIRIARNNERNRYNQR